MIDQILQIIRLYKKDIIMCPADYPFLYNKLEQTNILTGYKKHWRRVNESLCTYLISHNILKKNWKTYEKMFLNNFKFRDIINMSIQIYNYVFHQFHL